MLTADFTFRGYRQMVQAFREADYALLSFSEVFGRTTTSKPFVLLRHDIDLSLEKALRMAEVESEIGVVSTYFLMLRNDFYNLLSGHGSRLVRRILDLGHHLGLHFDCAAYPPGASIDQLSTACRQEVDLLEKWFESHVDAVSYHRPNDLVLSGDPRLSAPLPHTYMKEFCSDPTVTYLSDSMGQWRHGSPTESGAFQARRPIQVLTHPIWWNRLPQDPSTSLAEFLSESHRRLELALAANCKAYQLPQEASMSEGG